MGEKTGIEWADRTFQPWIGCSKVSPACDNCYAEALAKRAGWDVWGDDKARRFTSEAYWRLPYRWHRQALKTGKHLRVFTSLLDPFENRADLLAQRGRFASLIRETPALRWLLLTKRPENIGPLWTLPAHPVDNVWFGTTVEAPEYVQHRVVSVLRYGAAAPVRFLSIEPLLANVARELEPWVAPHKYQVRADGFASGECRPGCGACALRARHDVPRYSTIGWLILGGESGGGARPFNLAWARDLIALGKRTATPVFMKQMGAYPIPEFTEDGPIIERRVSGAGTRIALKLHDKHGGDPGEWPADLCVREYPHAA